MLTSVSVGMADFEQLAKCCMLTSDMEQVIIMYSIMVSAAAAVQEPDRELGPVQHQCRSTTHIYSVHATHICVACGTRGARTAGRAHGARATAAAAGRLYGIYVVRHPYICVVLVLYLLPWCIPVAMM